MFTYYEVHYGLIYLDTSDDGLTMPVTHEKRVMLLKSTHVDYESAIKHEILKHHDLLNRSDIKIAFDKISSLGTSDTVVLRDALIWKDGGYV